MKITCTKENLYKGLVITSNLTGRNPTLPILNNILLKTNGGMLVLQSTNLEIGVITKVRCRVEHDGAITVQGRLFTELVSLLPNNNITLELDGLNLKVNCAGHQSIIRGLSADDYPLIPEINNQQPISFKNKDLKEALAQVLLAVNLNENRPEISGVLFIFNDRGLILVGTDSYRLAEKTIAVVRGKAVVNQIIVPPRTAQQLIKILDNNEEADIDVVVGDNQIMFLVGETVIISRLISAEFPDYQQIIPKKFNTIIEIDKNSLLQAVRSAGLFTRSGINDVRLVVDVANKTVSVSSANNQIGEDVSVLSLNKNDGQDNEIVFNYRYLLDGLETIPGKEVGIKIADTNNPGLLKPINDDSYLYIIMPIRQ